MTQREIVRAEGAINPNRRTTHDRRHASLRHISIASLREKSS